MTLTDMNVVCLISNMHKVTMLVSTERFPASDALTE